MKQNIMPLMQNMPLIIPNLLSCDVPLKQFGYKIQFGIKSQDHGDKTSVSVPREKTASFHLHNISKATEGFLTSPLLVMERQNVLSLKHQER